MTDFTAEIDAGIKLLDLQVPNWRAKIDLDELDLGSCSVCILGQVFGDYDTGIDELGVSGYDYGFNTMSNMSALTAAWKEALGKNNTLVEKGDVYEDSHGYAVKVLQTHLVKVDDETISAYIVEAGSVRNGVFKGVNYGGKPSLTVLQKKSFEAGGSYSNKVSKLRLEPGMFITSKGVNYFVHSVDEVRELKDGAYAVNVSTLDLSDAKEMMTGMGVKFSQSVKRSF
jgi:hypothetical protein